MQTTEEQIRKVVSETLRKILAENGLLQEMAVSSKEYKKKVNSLLPQIAENWCLIYFFRRTGKPTTCLNHWCTELRDALIPLSRPILKGGDRESLLYKVWNENDLDNDFSAVELTVAGKFKAEEIDIKEYAQAFAETCKAFIMSTRPIVNIICKRSFDDIVAYIDTIGTKNILEESEN